jgi:hypothetical protein
MCILAGNEKFQKQSVLIFSCDKQLKEGQCLSMRPSNVMLFSNMFYNLKGC